MATSCLLVNFNKLLQLVLRDRSFSTMTVMVDRAVPLVVMVVAEVMMVTMA